IRPYKSLENRIDGAIVMLFDVHSARATSAAGEYGESVAITLMESARDPLVLLDGDLRIKRVNAAFEREFGADGAHPIGQPLERLNNKHLNLIELSKLLRNAWSAQTSLDDLMVPAEQGLDG